MVDHPSGPLRGADPSGAPRLDPVPREGWTDEIRRFFAIMEGPQTLEQGTRFTVQAVMANHPALATAWATYNRVIARDLSLDDRLREIAILRTAWNQRAGYEWYQHRILGRRCGLTEDELAAIAEGPDALVWSDGERLILRAADEMTATHAASAETIDALKMLFGAQGLMEILWVIGTYGMLGWILNSLDMPIEAFSIT